MSLVVALRVAGGDVLFAADKRFLVKKDNGVVVRRTDDATKLRAIADGVMGFAGRADFAQDLLADLVISGDARTDRMKQVRAGLCEQFSRKISCYPGDEGCEFLASDRGQLFKVRSPHFVPSLAESDFEAIGVTDFAHFVCGLFHPNRELSLLGAKRLAALMITVTAIADPTNVSEKMDIWLLRRGQSKHEVVNDVESVCEWVDAYRLRTINELHGLELPL